MHTQSLTEISKSLRSKQVSSRELVTHHLQRIRKQSALNAFITVDEEAALKAADRADRLIQKGEARPLTGIPLAHKDNFCTKGMRTTCASKMLADFKAPYDATIVKRFDEAGAVLLGKTNMDEFAMGSSNESSYFGCVKNPWDLSRVPGGSSGGSAAGVAARLVPFATGSDTGGSVRQPAAFCGISGLKPTYGRVSRFGLVAYASSLDQPGLFAHSAEDLAMILQAMAGFDPMDSTSSDYSVPDYSKLLNHTSKPIRIGLPTCFFHPDVSMDIQQAIQTALHVFEQAGAQIIELDLTLQPYWIPCYYIIACAEASSNLSRFDGVRFGHRAARAETVQALMKRSRSEGFGAEVKRRILTGTFVLSSGYFDDYYLQGLKVRRLIQEEILRALSNVDVILGPTTPTCAFKIGETHSKASHLADMFTVGANLAGLPALSIPAGFADSLPIGMQLIGPHFGEARLLQLAHLYQQNTTWHKTYPKEAP